MTPRQGEMEIPLPEGGLMSTPERHRATLRGVSSTNGHGSSLGHMSSGAGGSGSGSERSLPRRPPSTPLKTRPQVLSDASNEGRDSREWAPSRSNLFAGLGLNIHESMMPSGAELSSGKESDRTIKPPFSRDVPPASSAPRSPAANPSRRSNGDQILDALFPRLIHNKKLSPLLSEEEEPRSVRHSAATNDVDDAESSTGDIGFAFQATPPSTIVRVPHVFLLAEDFHNAISMLQVDSAATGAFERNDSIFASQAVGYFGRTVTLLLILIWPVFFYVFQAPYLYQAVHPATVFAPIYIFLGTFISYVLTISMDPGRLPLHVEPHPHVREHSDPSGVNTPVTQQAILAQPRSQRLFAELTRSKRGKTLPKGIQLPDPTVWNIWQRQLSQPEKAAKGPGGEKQHVRAMPIERQGNPLWLIYNGAQGDLATFGQRVGRAFTAEREPKVLLPRVTGNRQVLPRDIRVRTGQVLRMRWCQHCQLYPPPRAHHCSICDRCSENFHFHSRWLGCDVAKRNLLPFTTFLLFALLTMCYCIAFSGYQLYHLSTASSVPAGFYLTNRIGTFPGALSMSPFAAILFLGGSLLLLPTVLSLSYVLLLAFKGETGLQHQARKRIASKLMVKRPVNPFRRDSLLANLRSILCLGWPGDSVETAIVRQATQAPLTPRLDPDPDALFHPYVL